MLLEINWEQWDNKRVTKWWLSWDSPCRYVIYCGFLWSASCPSSSVLSDGPYTLWVSKIYSRNKKQIQAKFALCELSLIFLHIHPRFLTSCITSLPISTSHILLIFSDLKICMLYFWVEVFLFLRTSKFLIL